MHRRQHLAVLAAAGLLVGCGNGVEVPEPSLDAAGTTACDALVDDLPAELFGSERRETSPADAPAAAWGDPPVVLVCGADVPEQYDEFSACTESAGVGWFIPDEQLQDRGGDVEMTVMSHEPLLQLRVPVERREDGADAAMAELAPLVVEHLTATRPCH